MRSYRLLGLMSGSSLDGLDLACCRFDIENNTLKDWQLEVAQTLPYTETWQRRLALLPTQSAEVYAQTDVYFGDYMGTLAASFIRAHQIEAIDAIASHGHTIFHDPARNFTAQIGSGASLAARTGLDVLCDFRSMDVARGGQGAPLALLADRELFGGYEVYINLGGIANVSVVHGGRSIAFDVCACNQALNYLAAEAACAYDEDGVLSEGGDVQYPLLKELRALPYLAATYPKSLGNDWVRGKVWPILEAYRLKHSLADRLATVCAHIAEQLALAVRQVYQREDIKGDICRVLLTGGGAHHPRLYKNISYAFERVVGKEVKEVAVVRPSREVIDFKEAALMALLGVWRLEGKANCIPQATGARRGSCGGAWHKA